MKKLLFVLVISLLGIAIVIAGSENKKAKEQKAIELKTTMQSYDDYVAYTAYVEQYIKAEKEKGIERFIYEGEFKAMWDRMGELYNIALKDSQNGPNLTPPPIFMTCWHCQCMCYGCSRSLGNECCYGIQCTTVCPSCGCEVIMRWTNGDRCVQGDKCPSGA